MRVRLFVVLIAFLLSAIVPVAAVSAAGPYRDAALGALAWVAAQQQPDGSFPGFGPGSTADAVFAICAVDGDPNGFLRDGNSPISYLGQHAAELATNTGAVAKTILAATCAGKDPRAFGGVDLLAALEKAYDPASGHYGTDLAGHAFALLALASVQRPIPDAATRWLRQAQTPEGGWSWSGDPAAGGADTNSTALAIQALIAAGVPSGDPSIQQALAYLHAQQNDDGGFPYQKPSPWGTDTDANSTAYVVQALVAAGEDPEGPAWSRGGNTPLRALLSLQLPDGAFQWQAAVPGENALATYQAIVALMLRPFPLVRTAVAEPALLPKTGLPGNGPVVLGAVGSAAIVIGWVLRHRARARG
ncbi:MAG: prenyltransferase/squalene oxidase repeat-containing protein [Chloroflexia bacterium]